MSIVTNLESIYNFKQDIKQSLENKMIFPSNNFYSYPNYVGNLTNVTYPSPMNDEFVFLTDGYSADITSYNIENHVTAILDTTSNLIRMGSYCFYYWSNLRYIGNLYLPNCNYASQMFAWCQNLKIIRSLRMPNLVGTHALLQGCSNLTRIDNFQINANVTSVYGMFEGCSNLEKIPFFETKNCTSMAHFVYFCNNLKDIKQYNTQKVNDFTSFARYSNNLCNSAIHNIINMCLNSNVTNVQRMNLNTSCLYGPFRETKYTAIYYQNRLDEITAVGWSY